MARVGINIMVVALFALIIILTITGMYSCSQKEGFDPDTKGISSEPSDPSKRKQLYIRTNYGDIQMPSGSGYAISPRSIQKDNGILRPLSLFTVDNAIYFFPGKKDTGIDVTKRVRDLFKTKPFFPIDDTTLKVNMPYPVSPGAEAETSASQQGAPSSIIETEAPTTQTPMQDFQSQGQPDQPRPIIINVHNNGGSLGTRGNVGGPLNMNNNNNYRIRHELGENTNQKLDKTINFLEFIMQKSQNKQPTK